MSRLIIKNLPNKVTVQNLKEIFSQKGEVTDIQLKYTKDGKFRNFGFVGYKNEEQAEAAREYFDGTCIRSMKIQVQLCANLGDAQKPRAWSKYAPDSTAYKELHKDEIQEKQLEERQKKKTQKRMDKIKELLKKHKDDPLFAEFIAAHVNDKTAWIKEALEDVSKSDDEYDVECDKEKANDEEQTTNKSVDVTDETHNEEKVANKQISDLEYMKSLMKKVKTSTESPEEQKPKKIRNRQLFHVKITGLPFKCKKKDIKEFFRPLVPYSIRLPLGKGKKISGFCYVGFRTEAELKKALNKDKLFIGNHRLHIHRYEDKSKNEIEENEQTIKKKNQEKENNEESIGESGSIFVRNLPYIISEEELTNLFEKYGPLAEVNLPVDKVLRQPKGFATVTFVMPEHAVKAYTELDGTVFCGRMLHLLPAFKERLDDDSDDEGLSFKEKKAKKLKAQAKSSHNWNVLFLGVNAAAEVIASNYNTTKEQLLTGDEKGTSAAVKMALGETQLVIDTRKFLEENGVYLDAFNKPPKKRSKTCIIVKNLPANTNGDELKALLSKYGHIARFLMPQHGITALVDFIEPFEAKKAFTKLAYSQFKSTPLYLEWAPENVFIQTAAGDVANETVDSQDVESHEPTKDSDTEQKISAKEENDTEPPVTQEEETAEPEKDTSLFVKNLNFKTNEDTLKKHFSKCGKIHNVTIARKKDPKNPGQLLSMGYGFIQFYKKEHANEALKLLQSSTLDGKTLELKRSERGNNNEVKTSKKVSKSSQQNGSKILVRNVPFQANKHELYEIFKSYGQIRTLRLPKKLGPGSDQHRGFAFVDYCAKTNAKTAFEALCQSTHLYGRRLVLEWADQEDESEDVMALRKRTAQAFNAKMPGGKKSKKAAVDVEVFVDGNE